MYLKVCVCMRFINKEKKSNICCGHRHVPDKIFTSVKNQQNKKKKKEINLLVGNSRINSHIR